MRVFLPKGTLPTPYVDFLSAHPLPSIPLATPTSGNFHGFDARALLKWLGHGKQEYGLSSVSLEDIADQYTVWRLLTDGGREMATD